MINDVQTITPGRGRVHCENCIYYEPTEMHAKIFTKNCETYNYNLIP